MMQNVLRKPQLRVCLTNIESDEVRFMVVSEQGE